MNQIHSDGFQFHSNPSPVGGGFTLVDGGGDVVERKTILKVGMTNNEAELLGVVRAVELIESKGIVYTDSQVIARWVHRGRARGRPDLNEVIRKCKELVKKKKVEIKVVPRNENLAGIYNEKHRSVAIQS